MNTTGTDVQVDRNVDREFLQIVMRYSDNMELQQENLERITRSIHQITRLRRLLSVIFPLVEGNTRVYS